MILNDVIAPVEKVGVSKENTFKIKTSSKAFEILSKTIYSDIISAPIRELSANAWDSHIRSGNKEPFIVHLPNTFDHNFYVRDFGTGMSEDDIYNIYTTYFESTKSNSNDEVGCLGLGSKTPFCYTDLFVVTSYQNGIKRIYTSYLENGLPKIAKMHEETTDEKNGLMVSFSVKPEDFDTFYYKAKSVFHSFKNKPNIIGREIKYSQEDSPQYSGSFWELYRNDNHTSMVAVMGNISYPIDYNRFPSKYSKISSYHYRVLGSTLNLYFDIGEVEMSASREHLQYSDKTIEAVYNKFLLFCEEFTQKIQFTLDSLEDHLTAKCFYNKNDSVIKHLCGCDVFYKGINLNDSSPNFILNRFTGKTTVHDDLYIRDDSFKIYINDVKNIISRLKYNHTYPSGIYTIDTEKTDLVVNSLVEYYGKSILKNIIKASTLTDPPKTSTKRRVNGINYLYVLNKESYYSSSENNCWEWKEVDSSKEDIIVYFNIRNFKFIDYENESVHLRKSIINLIKFIDPENKIKIYGLNKELKTIPDNYIEFSDFLLKNKKRVLNYYRIGYANNFLKNTSYRSISYKKLLKNSPMYDNCRFLMKYYRYGKKFKNFTITRMECLFNKLSSVEQLIPKNLTEEFLYSNYPLLRHLNMSYITRSSEHIKYVTDYINLIDSNK